MSKTGERLFDAIGQVRDELVDEAAEVKYLKRKGLRPWHGAVAAALVLTVGLGAYFLPEMGGEASAPEASSPSAGENGAGSDGASIFMSYEGPVFPLTLIEKNEAITAERTLTLDFEGWVPKWVSHGDMLTEAEGYGADAEELAEYALELEEYYPEGGYYDKGTDLLVTDEYVLTNSSETSQEVEILYPYVSDLKDYRANRPTLLIDGAEAETTVYAGGYSGGFRGAGGENDGRLNLDQPDSWEDYQALLGDGTYLTQALNGGVDLSGIPAVVYRFTDAWGPERSDDIPNPSVRVSFELDYDKTTILSHGFHSGSFEPDSGWMGRGFSIPENFRWNADHPKYLIVVGEDVENMQTDFFATGGWDREKEVEGGVSVERYETDLASALHETAGLMFEETRRWENCSLLDEDLELYCALLCDWLCTYGLLSEDVAERYQYGMLGESDFAVVERVFYVRTAVTVSAQSSVTVTAELVKQASFDYACTGSENVGVSGYDAVTTLGSNLGVSRQNAVLEDRGQITIVRDNFGFDLENGVTEVELDINTEHYYLEVRRIEE